MSNIEKTPPSAQLRLTADAPVFAVAPSLTQLLAGTTKKGLREGDTKEIRLAHFLAAIFYVALGEVPAHFQGTSTIPVPAEALDVMGEILVGYSKWANFANMASAEAARAPNEQWQRQAEMIWQRNPKRKLSATAVALKIDPARFNTVRQVIRRPKK